MAGEALEPEESDHCGEEGGVIDRERELDVPKMPWALRAGERARRALSFRRSGGAEDGIVESVRKCVTERVEGLHAGDLLHAQLLHFCFGEHAEVQAERLLKLGETTAAYGSAAHFSECRRPVHVRLNLSLSLNQPAFASTFPVVNRRSLAFTRRVQSQIEPTDKTIVGSITCSRAFA